MVLSQYGNCHRINSFSVIGGFLDGMGLDFKKGLNCVIGHRGTGKTTVLEFIRYALHAFPNGQAGSDSRRRIESLVRSNLGDGRIRLTIDTRDGLDFIVDRTTSGNSIVLNMDGTPADLTIESGGLFRADIFSQNEVENIADSPRSQLALIDNFKADEIAQISVQIAAIKSSLQSNANQISPLKTQIAAIVEELNTLPAIEAQIKKLTGHEGQDSAQINQAHTERAIRDRQKEAVGEINELLTQYLDWFTKGTGHFNKKIQSVVTDDVQQGSHAEMIAVIAQEMLRLGHRIDQIFSDGKEIIYASRDTLSQRERQLLKCHEKQELAFRDLIAQHDAVRGIATERAEWERKRNDLLTKQRRHEELKTKLGQLQKERTGQVEKLQRLYEERFHIRRQVVEWINDNVTASIRVRIDQFGDKHEYQNVLKERIKNSGVNHGVVAGKIADLVPPDELISIVQTGTAEDLECRADLNRTQSQKVYTALKETDLRLSLDVVELADLPCIELLDGAELKNSLTLSTGQKCTTILPILLLDSAKPLLVDQPEDNLDNRFIYETVVESLRRVKTSRQIILITHNPNIPVLGEASRVFVLTSDGQHATLLNHGNVDDCKEEIINLLEGGRDAFSKRKERYDY